MSMKDEHHLRLERMYHTAPFNLTLNSSITIHDGKSTVKARVEDYMRHAGDLMHGAYYFMLLDNATFFAANSLVRDVLLLTQGFEIKFLHPVVKGELVCEGSFKEKRMGTYIATGELFNENGDLVGLGTGRFRRSKIMLNSISKYSEDLVDGD